MNRIKVYISGAISGRERTDYLFQFAKAEKELKKIGYKVYNPTKFLPSAHMWIYDLIGYKLTLIYDLYMLSKCDYIFMLAGWEQSKGARLELAAATTWGIKQLT